MTIKSIKQQLEEILDIEIGNSPINSYNFLTNAVYKVTAEDSIYYVVDANDSWNKHERLFREATKSLALGKVNGHWIYIK